MPVGLLQVMAVASQRKGAIRPGFNVWLRGADPKAVFGRGKWRLLEAIECEGSLRAAADALGISYRKAWGDLREAEAALGVMLLARRRGGSDGGRSTLTDAGRKWLREYRQFHARVEKAVARAFAAWEKGMQR